MGAERRHRRQLLVESTIHQSPPTAAIDFPLLPNDAAEPPTYPRARSQSAVRGLTEAEVTAPPSQVGRQLLHHLRETDPATPPRQLPDPLPKPLHGLGRDAPLQPAAAREAESQKLPLLRPPHRALGLVDRELETAGNEVWHRLHHPVPRPRTADVDVHIVCMAHKSVAPSIEFAVKLVEPPVPIICETNSLVRLVGLSGFPNDIFRPFGFSVGDLMGKALWKLVENAQRFPRHGGEGGVKPRAPSASPGPVRVRQDGSQGGEPCVMSNWTAASSDCGRPLNDDVHIKTADLYRPNARFTTERQRYQVLTPFGKLGYSQISVGAGSV